LVIPDKLSSRPTICPKCGSNDLSNHEYIRSSYSGFCNPVSDTSSQRFHYKTRNKCPNGEHFHRQCEYCGYKWWEEVE
jgi:ribosomal protein L32